MLTWMQDKSIDSEDPATPDVLWKTNKQTLMITTHKPQLLLCNFIQQPKRVIEITPLKNERTVFSNGKRSKLMWCHHTLGCSKHTYFEKYSNQRALYISS